MKTIYRWSQCTLMALQLNKKSSGTFVGALIDIRGANLYMGAYQFKGGAFWSTVLNMKTIPWY